jgi:hypothetical protein
MVEFSKTNRHQFQQLQTALESQIGRHARFAAHYSVQDCKAQIKSNCYMQLMKCTGASLSRPVISAVSGNGLRVVLTVA